MGAEAYEVLDDGQVIGIEVIVISEDARWYYSVDLREPYPIPVQSPFKGRFTGEYRDGQPVIIRYTRRLIWHHAGGLQPPTDQRTP